MFSISSLLGALWSLFVSLIPFGLATFFQVEKNLCCTFKKRITISLTLKCAFLKQHLGTKY